MLGCYLYATVSSSLVRRDRLALDVKERRMSTLA